VLPLDFAWGFALGVKPVGTPLLGAPTIVRASIAKAIGIFAGALAWTAAQASREALAAPVTARRAERA
jgi:hypothetical protein